MNAAEPNADGASPGAAAPYRFSFPLKILMAATGALMLALLIGFLLPGRWEVVRTVRVPAPPATVYPWLDDPRRWDDWAPLGDVETRFEGPERGPGATRSWDDPAMGDGSFRIVATVPEREVRYHVEVQEGSLVTDGTITLAPSEGGGTDVTWTERGDFGPNPLMGYTALGMDRMQGNQMENALRRLAELAGAGG